MRAPNAFAVRLLRLFDRAFLGGSAPPLIATVKGEVAAFAATACGALDGVAPRAVPAPPPGAGTRRRAGLRPA